MQNIPRQVKEGICDVLGRARRIQLLKMFQMEVRSNKFEPRVVVLAEYSMNIMPAKMPIRLEYSINFLDICSIGSQNPNKVTMATDTKKIALCQVTEDSGDIDELISCISETLVIVFPEITGTLLGKITLSPASRVSDLSDRLQDVRNKTVGGPCGSFTFAYHCMCDYHDMPFAEEVAWDIDTIYLSHASKELTLSDFDHLDPKFLTPVVSALQYNAWFTKLNLSNVKLTPEISGELLKVLKMNATIQELSLSNTGLKADYLLKLAGAFAANPKLTPTSLDMSENLIEDKGLVCILPVIGKLSASLSSLNFSRTGITAKGVNRLAETLFRNTGFIGTLKVLDLSENCLKGEELNNLHNYLAQPNALTTLNLAGTECSLEMLFGALCRGCVQHLTHLDVSRCVYSSKKLPRDVAVPMSWKDFFANAVRLQSISFAGSRLPSEALNCILVGLGFNSLVTNLELNLSNNAVIGPNGPQVLECLVGDIRCIGTLDISDNGLEQSLAGLLFQLGKNKHIRKLAIGKNLNKIKPQLVPQVMDAVVQLVQNEHSSLECLLLDDLKLKGDLATLLSALGSNSTLKELDISGNQAGDSGARMLSKALLMNKKLAVVYWDRNNTSPQGFADIATALERNFTLKKMPIPICDAATAIRISTEKTESALQKIESLLQRNHMPHRLTIAQDYRLQHGLMMSSTQQMIDSAMVQLQNVISKLQTQSSVTDETHEAIVRAQNLIKDVAATQQLLLEFQNLASDSEGETSIISTRLKSLSADLYNVVEKQLQSSTTAMMQRAEKQSSTIFTGKLKEELKGGASNLNSLSRERVSSLVSEQLGWSLLNSVDEVNLAVSIYLYGRMVEEFMSSLDSTLKTLKQALATASPPVQNTADSKKKRTGQTAAAKAEAMMLVSAPKDNEFLCSEEMRKTLFFRKIRPQSSLGSPPAEVEQRLPRKPPEFGDARRADIPRKESQSQPSQPSVAHMTGTTRSIFSPSFDYDSLAPDDAVPKLTHPAKERPKLRKTHYAKRPVIACESLLIEDTPDDSAVFVSDHSEKSGISGDLSDLGVSNSPKTPRAKLPVTRPSEGDHRASTSSLTKSDSRSSDQPPSAGAVSPTAEPVLMPTVEPQNTAPSEPRPAVSQKTKTPVLPPASLQLPTEQKPLRKSWNLDLNTKDAQNGQASVVKNVGSTQDVSSDNTPASPRQTVMPPSKSTISPTTPSANNGPKTEVGGASGPATQPKRAGPPQPLPRKSAEMRNSGGVSADAARSSPQPAKADGTQNQEGTKGNLVRRQAADGSVNSEGGVVKRLSVREAAAMFKPAS